MARITHVKRARGRIGPCDACRSPISKGDPYSWIKFRHGPRHVRCAKTACRFKRSDTTQSKLSAVYSAQEVAESELSKWDRKDHEALASVVTSAGEAVREVLDEYESAADEHPNLAGSTEEIRSSLEDIADELERFEVEEHDPEVESLEVWAERVLGEASSAIERISEV